MISLFMSENKESFPSEPPLSLISVCARTCPHRMEQATFDTLTRAFRTLITASTSANAAGSVPGTGGMYTKGCVSVRMYAIWCIKQQPQPSFLIETVATAAVMVTT